MKHPTELVLQRYAAGSASPEEIVEVDGHAADCAECLVRLRAWEHALAAVSTLEPIPEPVAEPVVHPEEAPATNPAAAEVPEVPTPPDRRPSADAGILDWIRGWFAAKPGFTFGLAAGLALAVIVAVLRPDRPDLILAIADSNGTAGFTEEGTLVLADGSDVPPAEADAIRRLLADGELPLAPSIAAISGDLDSEVIVLGTAADETRQPTLRFPVSTAVPVTRPRFLWNKVKGAESYTVLLTDADGRLTWEMEMETEDASITYPSDEPDLERGRIYTWQVETTVGGELRIAQSRKFLVLPEEASEAVARAKEQFGDSALVMAAVYGRYGMNQELERALLELRSLNPANTNIITMIQRIKQPLDGPVTP